MDIRVASAAERPDLRAGFPDSDPWPAFMNEDETGMLYYSDPRTVHPQFCLIAYDAAEPDRAVARAYCVPFSWDGDPSRGELPGDGWDGVIRRAAIDRQLGRKANLVSALEITVSTTHQRAGLSALMLDEMRRRTAEAGFGDLVAPVRPSAKHLAPDESIHDYARRVRPDGLPEDPWLRVHARAGGRIVGVSTHAMAVTGTLEQWRGWTGLPFDASGPVLVPGALVPVHCSVEHDYAVYVEPNVWVHHRLA